MSSRYLWVCRTCGHENHVEEYRCSSCDSPRPGRDEDGAIGDLFDGHPVFV